MSNLAYILHTRSCLCNHESRCGFKGGSWSVKQIEQKMTRLSKVGWKIILVYTKDKFHDFLDFMFVTEYIVRPIAMPSTQSLDVKHLAKTKCNGQISTIWLQDTMDKYLPYDYKTQLTNI